MSVLWLDGKSEGGGWYRWLAYPAALAALLLALHLYTTSSWVMTTTAQASEQLSTNLQDPNWNAWTSAEMAQALEIFASTLTAEAAIVYSKGGKNWLMDDGLLAELQSLWIPRERRAAEAVKQLQNLGKQLKGCRNIKECKDLRNMRERRKKFAKRLGEYGKSAAKKNGWKVNAK
jgi:hypothetical protein